MTGMQEQPKCCENDRPRFEIKADSKSLWYCHECLAQDMADGVRRRLSQMDE